MNVVLVQALVRHLLTALAGAYAVKYGIEPDAIDAIISGAAALIGVGWSIYDKRTRQ